jgi:Ca2+-binding RTX toxin-like protein
MAAFPSITPRSLTGNEDIDSITSGYYWKLDSSRTLNWSISDGFKGEFWTNPLQTKQEIDQALSAISYYANIKFNYTGYYKNPAVAAPYSQLNFSLDGNGYFTPDSNVWAVGYFPMENNNEIYAGAPGDIFINVNSQANYLPGYYQGSAGFALLEHEIGHALGLKHTHDDGGTGRPTLKDLGYADFDQDWMSIMSYEDAYQWNLISWEPATLMALDALGVMAMYGPNMATNAGDSYGTLSDLQGYVTLWDASGVDTLNIAEAPEGWVIDLQIATNELLNIDIGMAFPGSQLDYSDPHSLIWLLGTNENVNGSAYSDDLSGNNSSNVLLGNSGNDFLAGRGGNDYIDGGRGIDTAIYAESRSAYKIGSTNSGFTVSSMLEGYDSMINIERIQFSGKNIALDLHENDNAGRVVKTLGAVFGATSVIEHPDYVGIGLNLIDSGMSYGTLMTYALSAAGANTHQSVVNLLFSNIVGHIPSEAEAKPFIDMLSSGWSIGALATMAGDTFLNQANINLVGLLQTGVEYISAQ